MKSFNKLFVLFIAILNSITLIGQEQTLFAEENKTLQLNTNQLLEDQTIQWQESTNNSDWNSIDGATTSFHMVTLTNLPKYYRATITATNCENTFFSDAISVFKKETSEALLWSNPATWGESGKPKEGDAVTIPMGKHILLDETPPNLGKMMIMGTLEFDRKDLSLTTENIMVHAGELIIGTERRPFTKKAVITLTDTNVDAENTRGIMVMMGGKLELHGVSPDVAWTKINAHAEDGATQLTLKDKTNWKADDEIIVGPTDFYEAANGKSITQKRTIKTINEKDISLNTPLEAFHWGLLQYATNKGMSLVEEDIVPTPTGDFLYGITPNNPKILDERAPVGNLTRNIVVQSPDDEAWKNNGFGAHIMIMRKSEAHLDGVEIKRGGQRGKLGRYPFHWHMLSYKGSENLGDATGQYIKNSTINVSMNRGIVVHGTNGTLVKNNVVFDTKGHAIFTEDAAERRNTFDNNLVLKVRSPGEQFALKLHEIQKGNNNRGASGFWISNPDNTTINNHVGDSQGTGYWLAFPDAPLGESSEALYDDGKLMVPRRIPFGVFENNTAHTCRGDALHNDNPEINKLGKTGRGLFKNYISDETGRNVKFPRDTWQRFNIKRFSAWKSHAVAWERATHVNALEAVGADNQDTFFAGSGIRGLIIGGLVVGRSLNYKYNASKINDEHVHNAFASYHHTFDIQGNIAINFQPTDGADSGVFGITDYYLRPVEKGHWLSKSNILINSHPGVRITASEANNPGHVDPIKPHFNLAGAVWDPQGQWGPINNYLVPDKPFYTYGSSTISNITPNTEVSGGVSIEGTFYGIDGFAAKSANGSFHLNGRTEMKFTRYDNQLKEVDNFTLHFNDSDLLQNMKDFAAKKDGVFEVEFPLLNDIYDEQFSAQNFLTENDELLIAFEFSGKKNATVRGYDKNFTLEKDIDFLEFIKKSNFQEVKESPTAAYWQDKANEKVWMKIKGGFINHPLNIHRWEGYIYQNLIVRIWER